MLTCPNCHTQHTPPENYCSECGAALADAPTPAGTAAQKTLRVGDETNTTTIFPPGLSGHCEIGGEWVNVNDSFKCPKCRVQPVCFQCFDRHRRMCVKCLENLRQPTRPGSVGVSTPRPPAPRTVLQYQCEDCGEPFPSHIHRQGPKYCGGSPGARDCRGARGRNGMGPKQVDSAGPSVETCRLNTRLEGVLKLCEQRSKEVYVGYSGGGPALRQAVVDGSHAEKPWKWHDPRANGRVADPWNWIPGSWFLAIVASKPQVSNWTR
jgi:hypothetical protein